MKKYKGKKLDFNNLPGDVQTFIKKVEIFYTRNQQENKNNGFIKILLIISLATALLFPVVLGRFFLTKDTNQVPKILGSSYQINTNDANDIEIFQLEDDLDNDKKLEKIDFKSYFSEPDRLRNTEVMLNNNKVLHLDGCFWRAYTKDIDKDNVKELIIALAVGMNGIWTEIYTFKDNQLNNIAVIDENNNNFSGFLGKGIKFIDYDNDEDLEVESFWRIYDVCDPRSDIYEYINGGFIFKKAIVPTIEEKLDCQEAMKEFKG